MGEIIEGFQALKEFRKQERKDSALERSKSISKKLESKNIQFTFHKDHYTLMNGKITFWIYSGWYVSTKQSGYKLKGRGFKNLLQDIKHIKDKKYAKEQQWN